jgi:hypothetical protein
MKDLMKLADALDAIDRAGFHSDDLGELRYRMVSMQNGIGVTCCLCDRPDDTVLLFGVEGDHLQTWNADRFNAELAKAVAWVRKAMTPAPSA